MESCASVWKVITYSMEHVSNVPPTLLGMERIATLKPLLTLVEAIKSLSTKNASAKMDSTISRVSACNALQEQLGTESSVTVNQLAIGVWDSQILTLLMEAAHVLLDLLSSMDVVFPNDLLIYYIFFVSFL